MLGLSRGGNLNAVSHAWVDGHSLRTYRPRSQHRPRASPGPRAIDFPGGAPRPDRRPGRWAYPSVLTAKTWGFYDVLFAASLSGFRGATAPT